EFIYAGAENSQADVLIVEIGGTTGDIESQPFLEAIRQISLEVGKNNCLFIHVTLVPYLPWSGEHKTKPTQHSVKNLLAMGISPDIIVARADQPLGAGIKTKISLHCNVKPDCVIENLTAQCLYEVPLVLQQKGLDRVAARELGLDLPEPDLAEWKQMLAKIKAREKQVSIAIVGKYVGLHDAYLSIVEGLNHAGFDTGTKVNIRWLDSEDVTERNVRELLNQVNAIIVPYGFGHRGIEGKIITCRYARENKIPFLGICLGLQVAVIEFARNVAAIRDASSGEFDWVSDNLVINTMPEQVGVTQKGGTMRLGAYPCKIQPGTLLHSLYGTDEIKERHRHRYEVNNHYRGLLTENGLCICGTSPDGRLVEAVELPQNIHPFYIGVQFHPEFLSRPNRPHPLFVGLVRAALKEGVQ
ncbi:MAG: CTP synthase, partial [bacterium]